MGIVANSLRRPSRSGTRLASAVLVAGAALVLTACGSSSNTPKPSTPGTSSAPSQSTSGASTPAPATPSTAPAPVESNPPGDIPDNQTFVPFAGTGYAVSVPEGWARTTAPNGVTFSDKYNAITVTTLNSPAAPTPASARLNELPAIQATAKGFTPGSITTVQRTAGSAVLITYHALSAVNPVTGKVANEAVERYEFWRAGHEVVLTLAAPVGSDNVDPWRTVTDSFRWTAI